MSKESKSMTAAELWDYLDSVDDDFVWIKGQYWYGSFLGHKGYISFSCPDGCCDDFWDNREDFVKSHGKDKFWIDGAQET